MLQIERITDFSTHFGSADLSAFMNFDNRRLGMKQVSEVDPCSSMKVLACIQYAFPVCLTLRWACKYEFAMK